MKAFISLSRVLRLPGAVRDFHISLEARKRYQVSDAIVSLRGTVVIADLAVAQQLARAINEQREAAKYPHLAVTAGELFAAGLLHELAHLLILRYFAQRAEPLQEQAMDTLTRQLGAATVGSTLEAFVETFPTVPVAQGRVTVEDFLAAASAGTPNRHVALEEMLLLRLANTNPALERFGDLFDDSNLAAESAYLVLLEEYESFLTPPPGTSTGPSLIALLRAPLEASPTSLAGQLRYVQEHWGALLGDRLAAVLTRVLTSLDILKEENRPGFTGPGPIPVPDATTLQGISAPEYERFSADQSWMPELVVLAKSTYVWLDQMSKRYGQDIHRLDQIPDQELDELAGRGFTGLWLIGLWRRSEASRRIKHLRGQPDAVASAYALHDYVLADDLGGETAYRDLRDRAWARGMRLASDMVPNHVGIDSRWVIEHPEWFVQLADPPYPGYTFNGPDLSTDERVAVFIEDHYYDNSDAAVVFKRLDRASGEVRYLYHGNDGTSTPWNDTAQIDYLNPEAREAVIQTILHVARLFPVIRFDAAMTLAKQHIQRLWFPPPGMGGAIPSRSQFGSLSNEEFEQRMPHEFWREVVDRVAAEVPDTLLLAEAFWMMEGYFVRTLGMHRVYNSAFMNMMKEERNADYRLLIKNVLEFDPRILGRYVNFMNNPDEETAVGQFGKDDKYFGVATVMSTLPGLPMFGHGQIEGFTEKYGMEYRTAKRDEQPDPWLVDRHRREIVPLLKRRAQFAGVADFLLYDLVTADGTVNEDVFAYSNRHDGAASLVVFHNRFATVRGWLKRSVAYTVIEDGVKRMVHRDLHQGLGVSGGPDRFVVMREAISGLEHLFRADRFVHEGFYLELEAFHYRVYLDVRELRDSDGELARLDQELAGRGVSSIEDALHELRLRPLHAAILAALEAGESGDEAAVLVAAARDALVAQVGGDGAPATPPDEDATDHEAEALVPESAEPEALRAAALLSLLEVTPERYLELRLADRFERAWSNLPDPGGAALVVPVLLDLERGQLTEAATPQDVLDVLDDTPAVRALLGVHRYDGVRWFRQERFSLLAAALVPWLTRVTEERPRGRLVTALERAAEDAGYRFDSLLSSEPLPSPAPSSEPDSRT